NRLTEIDDPVYGATKPTRYEYDAVGNLIRITNARGYATQFSYDAANRLTQVTDALQKTTKYGYDPVGNRISMQDRNSMTTHLTHSYMYDAVNRLTQVSAGSITVSYTYDGNGNRSTMVDPATTTYFFLLLRFARPTDKYNVSRWEERAIRV
ncbi:MAG: hypothetical protein E6G98_13225, partial [Bacillati bacterium ANGP1]